MFSVQIPHLAHDYLVRSVFQQILEVYIHVNFLILEYHCGVSVRFIEEFSMPEFTTHFSFLAGQFLVNSSECLCSCSNRQAFN